MAVDKKWFYAISNTKISKCDKLTGKVVTEWVADRKKKTEAHFKHLNSGTVVGKKLYCAHSRFPLARNDCTVEIFDIGGNALNHEKTIRIPGKHGSLTWIDQSSDGSWWMCYAVYGKDSNKKTKLVKYRYEDGTFIEGRSWFFPEAVVPNWGTMSSSGGSWGRESVYHRPRPNGGLRSGNQRSGRTRLCPDGEGPRTFRASDRVGSILRKASPLGNREK